jgi:hypothetical protein
MEKLLPSEDMKAIDDRFWSTIERERKTHQYHVLVGKGSVMNNNTVAKTTDKRFKGNC